MRFLRKRALLLREQVLQDSGEFFDAGEVAQFGIGMTIVEPGGARTEFRYGSAKVADLMPEYESCHGFLTMLDPAKGLASGDPVRMCERIIESVAQEPAPLRMVPLIEFADWTSVQVILAMRLGASPAACDGLLA